MLREHEAGGSNPLAPTLFLLNLHTIHDTFGTCPNPELCQFVPLFFLILGMDRNIELALVLSK